MSGPAAGSASAAEPPDDTGPTGLYRLMKLLWRLLLALVLLLAAYVLAARLLIGGVATWKEELLTAANARLPFTLQASELEGQLQGFSPEIVLRQLVIQFDQPGQAPIILSEGRLRLNPLGSLLTLSPQISDLHIAGLNLQMAFSADGVLRLAGFETGLGLLREWFRNFLSRVDTVHIDRSRVLLRDARGETLSDALLVLDLRRQGGARSLDVSLSLPGNAIRLLAHGVGDPLAGGDWQGDAYLNLQGNQFENMAPWIPEGALPMQVSGRGSLEVWLSRADGRSDVALRTQTQELVIAEAGGGWTLPLQGLSMTASLSEIIGGWRLQARDLSVAHEEQRWDVSRASFQLLGDSLSARVADMRLDDIENLLASAPAMPDTLAAALGELRPRGFLTAADLVLDDVRAPGRGWRLAARLEDASVDSWRGAPGFDGLSALVSLSSDGGRILMDGRDISLTFPTVYREPLGYEALYGELRLAWDDEAVRIDSDLLTARGPEGTAKAVFSLNVPRRDSAVGPAMSLLVGLRDSKPQHRVKYLPFTLPDGVITWLQDSVGDGRIEQGGFVWRGSLRRDRPEHRTVQMFFELQETAIRFDPQWPAMQAFSGPVLIDDRNVSVWGKGGSIAGLQVDSLSVEMGPTAAGDLELAVASALSGDAGAALDVLRDSPLDALTAGALRDWRASGPARGDLQLRLSVLDLPAGAEIDVQAALEGVDLDIRPGRLPLRDLKGPLRFRSGSGFAGSEVAGTLWGEPMQARHSGSDSAEGGMDIRFAGDADAGQVLDWLGLDLAVISGKAAVQGELSLARGRAPGLSLSSDLRGVTLDLPRPWGKDADETRALELALRLGKGEIDLEMSLDDTLAAALQISDGRPVGGNLALESDWLQAVYSPGASPAILIDWLDLDGLAAAFPARQDEADAREQNTDESLAGLYRFLSASPPVDIQLLDLRRGDRRGSHLAFHFESDGSALYARDIQGDIFGLRSGGELAGGTEMRWSAGRSAFATTLDIDLEFGNLATVFESLGFAPSLESRRGTAVASLRWPGTPLALDFEELQGTLQIQARDGRVLQSPGGGASGALKVVTLLNLAEILKSLSLSSMFESGIPFDRARADLVLNRGQLRIPSLTLDGSASAFRFTGTTDLQQVDGELVVTLPVANNLPWVAALAAGLPVAAGVFVASKVFEKQVERMSSGIYSVSGSVDSPRVRLKRIFDNKPGELPDAEPDSGDQPAPSGDDSESSRR